MFSTPIERPSKQAVRAWMEQRQRERGPLPDLAQIRRQLDWRLARPACAAPAEAGLACAA